MSVEYLITLPDGSLEGPYLEEDLLDMVDADELAAGTICQNTSTGHRCRVHELFRVIAPAPPSPGPSEEAAPPPARWVPAPVPPPPVDRPPQALPAPVRLIYAGHPSYWRYWRGLAGSVLLMAAGWYAGKWGGSWLVAGWLSGGTWLALVLLRRSAIEYRITTRRVEASRGFFLKSSQEIRLADIRSIHVTKSGFLGLLGVGDLGFSSVTEGTPDVTFHQTPAAHRLKNRVRHLQDRGVN